MSKWEEDFAKLQEQAKAAGPVPLLPEQIDRQKACDDEVTKVCAKHKCVPVAIETKTELKANGQPMGGSVQMQIVFMPIEVMQQPPEKAG